MSARRTGRRVHLAVALALLVSLFAVAPVAAVPEELRDELERAEARLAELDARASAAVEEVNAAQVAVEEAEARIAGLAGDIDALEARIAEGQAAAGRYASSLYKHGPVTPFTAAFDASGPADAGVRMVRLVRVTEHRQRHVAALVTDRLELEQRRTELTATRDEARDRAAELTEQRASLEALLEEQGEEVAALRARVEEIERQEREERERQERLERERREEQRRREAAAAEERAAEAAPPSPAPAPQPAPAPAPAPAPSGGAQAAVDTALAQVGKPYRWGGSGPDSFDCSGLTGYAWRAGGKSLPHSSRAQFSATKRISRSQLQPGDLIFFGSPIHHVAIYIGNGEVVEAPYSGAQVRVNGRSLSRTDIAGYGRP